MIGNTLYLNATFNPSSKQDIDDILYLKTTNMDRLRGASNERFFLRKGLVKTQHCIQTSLRYFRVY